MISNSQPTRNGTPQVQSIIITAITLFAFSGLMVGFTVGAFSHSPRQSTNNTNQTNPITNRSTPTPTLPPTVTGFIRLGALDLKLLTAPPNPDGTQPYNASIEVKDSADPKKPLMTDGLVCRIWLVPQGDAGTRFEKSAADQLQHIEKLAQPFPQEVPNALVFDPPSLSEVQLCPQGSAQWKFTLSPSIPKGDYYLVGLADWQGKSYNWIWRSIKIEGKK